MKNILEMADVLSERQKDRFKAIRLLAEGTNVNEVARKMHKDPRWVSRTRDRFKELGSLKDRSRPGAPKKLTEADRKRLVKQVQGKERRSLRKTAKSFKTKDHGQVGRETIRTNLKASGLFPHRKRKVPRLTPDQKRRRVAFARKYRRYDWTKCAFWDETEFELYATPNRKNDIVWDKKGAEYRAGKVAHPPKFKFGAAITVHGPTRIVRYTGTIDSTKYIEMVDKVIPDLNRLFKKGEWTWVQDGASPHTSKMTLSHLKSVVPDLFPTDDWPANSPDDNPAENVFGFTESEVNAKSPETIKSLEGKIRAVWKKLTPQYCRSCIEALPARLKQMIDSGGEYVYEVKLPAKT